MSYESSYNTAQSDDYSNHYDVRDRIQDFVEDHRALTTLALLGATAASAIIGFNGLKGGTDDPSRFTHDSSVTSVTLEEGARVRHDPNVSSGEDDNLISVIETSVTLHPTDGVYNYTERHNGDWTGVDPASIPNFDAQGDKDGIVWINEQKIAASTGSDK